MSSLAEWGVVAEVDLGVPELGHGKSYARWLDEVLVNGVQASHFSTNAKDHTDLLLVIGI